MKEFFLGAVFACDELHIINHQDIDGTKDFFEIHHLAITQGLHETVHELFRRQVKNIHVRSALSQFAGDGVHQVGFAQPHAAIQKQRVECDRPAFGDAFGRRMRQLIGLAHDKIVKAETRVKRRGGHDAGSAKLAPGWAHRVLFARWAGWLADRICNARL